MLPLLPHAHHAKSAKSFSATVKMLMLMLMLVLTFFLPSPFFIGVLGRRGPAVLRLLPYVHTPWLHGHHHAGGGQGQEVGLPPPQVRRGRQLGDEGVNEKRACPHHRYVCGRMWGTTYPALTPL